MNSRFNRILRVRKKPSPISYWGIHKDYGEMYGFYRCSLTPHLKIRSRPEAYCGWDSDRGRFCIRPLFEFGIRNLGWRKSAFPY